MSVACQPDKPKYLHQTDLIGILQTEMWFSEKIWVEIKSTVVNSHSIKEGEMKLRIAVVLIWVFVLPVISLAQEAPTINERLARLEEGQKGIHQRIDDVNERIGDLRSDMNDRFALMDKRFEDMNRKFNWLYMLLAAIIALNGTMVASVIWMARQEHPIGEKQYNEILTREEYLRNEIREIKSRLDRLEKA